VNEKIKDPNVELLFDAILQLRTKEECFRFFEDLCTIPELLTISQRLLVAKRLREKTFYEDIVKEVGASTATISRVNRALKYGCDGYKMVFDRLEEQNKK